MADIDTSKILYVLSPFILGILLYVSCG